MILNHQKRITALRLVIALGTALLAHQTALAQSTPWPNKPIKLIVVFPAGGSVDQVARIIGPALSQSLGQNIIIDNKGGASGAIGTQAVAKSDADGYTFGLVFDTHAVNPALIASLGYDTLADLTHVSLIGTAPMVIAASTKSEFTTFGQVLQAAKTKGQGPSYGTIGAGSLGHLALALFGKANGLDFNHVPYRGGGPMITDLVGGQVPLGIGSVFLMKPQIDARNLRPLAVTTSKRSPDLPTVPTIAESGYVGFDAPAWWGMIAPAKVPPEIIAKIHSELIKVLRSPAISKRLDEQGIDIVGSNPKEFAEFVKKQMEIWGKVVKDGGITAGG